MRFVLAYMNRGLIARLVIGFETFVVAQLTNNLFGLAFDAFDDALSASLGS